MADRLFAQNMWQQWERQAMSETCDNCGAVVPDGCGRDPRGRKICCPACVFNPLGCRCQYGEFGVSETFMDTDEYDSDDDYDLEEMYPLEFDE